jgi:predicted hotdog family 3-hydroxylacyl-ACP dehydratase
MIFGLKNHPDPNSLSPNLLFQAEHKSYLYTMAFQSLPAAEFIPQKDPFVLVDTLLFADEEKTIASFKIPEEHIFVRNGRFSTSGMVESMAQTAAAGTGYLYRKNKKQVPVGYIGAVQKLEVQNWPPGNADITMEINLLNHILQVSLVSGVVRYNEKIIASCEMKIFINPS